MNLTCRRSRSHREAGFFGCVPPITLIVYTVRTPSAPSLWELSFLSNIMDPSCRESTHDHSQHQLFLTFLEEFWWTWHVADRDPTPKQDSSAEFCLPREYALVVCTSVCHQIWVTNIMDPSCRASTHDHFQFQLFLDFSSRFLVNRTCRRTEFEGVEFLVKHYGSKL